MLAGWVNAEAEKAQSIQIFPLRRASFSRLLVTDKTDIYNQHL